MTCPKRYLLSPLPFATYTAYDDGRTQLRCVHSVLPIDYREALLPHLYRNAVES